MVYPLNTAQDRQTSSERPSVDEFTTEANAFLKRNDLAGAYPYVCRLATEERSSASTNVTAGLLALTLGHRVEAAEHFQRAVQRNPNEFDAHYNLALLEMANNKWEAAVGTFERLIRLHPNNAALHNDLAIARMKQKNHRGALKAFEKALTIDPNYTKARHNAMQLVVENNLHTEGKRLLQLNERHPQISASSLTDIRTWQETIERSGSTGQSPQTADREFHVTVASRSGRVQGKKLAFFATQPTFIEDIIARLSNENEMRLFNGQTVGDMMQLLHWADLAWFEWCDQLIIEATKQPQPCPIVCRLHSYEAFTDMPRKVDWRRVDHLVFVNRSVKEIFERQVRVKTPVSIIHNGVDLEKFAFPPDKKYGKKIASVGYINYKKNPALLLYCFKKIHAHDPEYTLHIAGQHQDARLQVYFEHFLRENPLPVKFDGWVEDMPDWYADKDFVISTSLFESFHYSIAEGMAAGLLPLIHNWYGADYLYPEKLLFNDPDDCLKLLQRLESCDKDALATENRQFIAQRYDQNDRYEEIVHLMAALVNTTVDSTTTPERL